MKYQARILVVDDDRTFCEGVANVLEREKYMVDKAYSGEEALKLEQENDYAVIIADLMMPGISGLEMLKKLKQRWSDPTIIMITGYPSIKSAVQSIKSGAFDYIPKPFTPGELRSLVSRALERRYLFEEMAAKAGLEEKKLVEMLAPEDIYCIPEHAWAKVEKNGRVRLGIHHVFLKTIKDIFSIEFPGRNEIINQGEVCIKITDSCKRVHRIWMPLTGKVIAKNGKIVKDFSKLVQDPYREGWLLLVSPVCLQDDLKNLTPLQGKE